MDSGYVCAGFETIAATTNKFVSSDRFDNNFTPEQIAEFFSQNCNKYLHSFGQNFGGKKNYIGHIKSEAKLLQNCIDTGIFTKSEFFIDSGGFQISTGVFDNKEFQNLHIAYHTFLLEHVNLYDRAFVLDVPPGPGCKVFSNFDEVYETNKKTYLEASNFPKEVKDKMIYIHHFRTPRLWNIFTRIMDEHDLFNHFKYHATGGIVANMASDMAIPCIIYILPLIPLINRAIKHGRSELHFHVLGGSTYRDILFYELFRKHILEKHNFTVHITFDSSSIFKGFMMGRRLQVLYDDMIKHLDLRESKLGWRFDNDKTIMDVFKDAVTKMTTLYGIKQIPLDTLYSEETGTFYYENRTYIIFYMLYFYAEVQRWIRQRVDKIYDLFDAEEYDMFTEEIVNITRSINGGRLTKKQMTKQQNIIRTMNMLTSLDENHCQYIVDKFLAKDEFVNLIKDQGILSF